MSEEITPGSIVEVQDTPFKSGDWIIATKPIMVLRSEGGLFGGYVKVPDSQYMRKPVRIISVTEGHVLISWPSKYSTGKDIKEIIPLNEIRERGFIIADPALVEVAGEV